MFECAGTWHLSCVVLTLCKVIMERSLSWTKRNSGTTWGYGRAVAFASDLPPEVRAVDGVFGLMFLLNMNLLVDGGDDAFIECGRGV